VDPNGMQALLRASAGEIRLLEAKLTIGQAYAFVLRLGKEFRPSEMVAYIRPTPAGYQLRVAAGVAYAGDSIQLWYFATRGWHEEHRIANLIGFLRRHFADVGMGLEDGD
jgi:hypothetical protein